MHRGLYGRHVGLVWLHLPHHWVRILVCIHVHDHTFMGVNVRCDQPGVGVGVGQAITRQTSGVCLAIL